MRMGRNHVGRLIVGTGCIIIVLRMFAGSHAQQRADQSVAIDNDDIGGVVNSSDGHNTANVVVVNRSEEHTSEIQSLAYLVCRLLLEKKKKEKKKTDIK